MLIKRPADIRSSEITDKKLYLNRRQFIQAAGAIAGAATGVGVLTKGAAVLHAVQPAAHGRKLRERQEGQPLQQHQRRSDEHVGANHHVQQLLRVRHRQRPARRTLEELQDRRVDAYPSKASAPSRASTRSTTSSRARRSKSASTGCAASKRGRWSFRGPAFRSATSSNAAGRRRRRTTSGCPRSSTPSRCRVSARTSSTGRTSKRCAWTKPCTRSPFSPSGSTAKRCRTRTARPSAWSCRGSTGSRA